jgi:hypothetical protein
MMRRRRICEARFVGVGVNTVFEDAKKFEKLNILNQDSDERFFSQTRDVDIGLLGTGRIHVEDY